MLQGGDGVEWVELTEWSGNGLEMEVGVVKVGGVVKITNLFCYLLPLIH